MRGDTGFFIVDDFYEVAAPLSERELDALDAMWRPVGLLATTILGGTRMASSVARYLEWRDLWNARRAISYYEGDVYDNVD